MRTYEFIQQRLAEAGYPDLIPFVPTEHGENGGRAGIADEANSETLAMPVSRLVNHFIHWASNPLGRSWSTVCDELRSRDSEAEETIRSIEVNRFLTAPDRKQHRVRVQVRRSGSDYAILNEHGTALASFCAPGWEEAIGYKIPRGCTAVLDLDMRRILGLRRERIQDGLGRYGHPVPGHEEASRRNLPEESEAAE